MRFPLLEAPEKLPFTPPDNVHVTLWIGRSLSYLSRTGICVSIVFTWAWIHIL